MHIPGIIPHPKNGHFIRNLHSHPPAGPGNPVCPQIIVTKDRRRLGQLLEPGINGLLPRNQPAERIFSHRLLFHVGIEKDGAKPHPLK